MFFTVLWRGVCQAVEWCFGLFGFRREGRFARCIWGLFATSGAIVMASFAALMVYCLGMEMQRWYHRSHCSSDGYCYHAEHVNRDIYYHNTEDGKSYIYNKRTGEKLIKNIAWIASPLGNDSLVCFSDGKKRGYFSMNTGRVVIEPQYDRAWVFSDGLASVEEGGYIKFIDATGKVVIDQKMPYIPGMEGYVFHGGYCVVDTDDGEQCGLMDKKGSIVVPLEYSSIDPTNDFKLWRLEKGDEMAVIDSELKTVLPLSECSISIGEETIDVTLPDHTMRKYDMAGNLISDFYIASVCMLEYEKEEILYATRSHDDDGNEYAVPVTESYHPKAVARLRAYVAGDGYEGLMTADGHKVTMPLYWDIEALGHDLYLCSSKNGDKLIVNGKGEIVE